MNCKIDNDNSKPSTHLNVEMSATQENLLNITPKDFLLGFIAYYVKGKGSVHKIAKLSIDCIEGNIKSYSRVINNTDRLKAINGHNELCADVAEVSIET